MSFISNLVTKACVAYLNGHAGKNITSAILKRKVMKVEFSTSTIENIDKEVRLLAKSHIPQGYAVDSYSTVTHDTGNNYRVIASIHYVELPSSVILNHMNQLVKRNEHSKEVMIKWE